MLLCLYAGRNRSDAPLCRKLFARCGTQVFSSHICSNGWKRWFFAPSPIALSSTSVTQELLCFPWFLQDFLWRQQLGSFDRRRLSYPEDVEKVIKLVQEASWAGYCLFSFYMWINIYNSSGRPFRKLTPLGLCEQLHFEAFVNFCQVNQGRVKCQPRPEEKKLMNNVWH